jgi:hypothetical protein
MQQLWKMAEMQAPPAPAASSFETTNQAQFKPHDMTGVRWVGLLLLLLLQMRIFECS